MSKDFLYENQTGIVIRHFDFIGCFCFSGGDSVPDENLWQTTFLVKTFEKFESQMCASLLRVIFLLGNWIACVYSRT